MQWRWWEYLWIDCCCNYDLCYDCSVGYKYCRLWNSLKQMLPSFVSVYNDKKNIKILH